MVGLAKKRKILFFANSSQLKELNMNTVRLLSVEEICQYLGLSRDTVYKWISERQMPGHKIGRLWKFNKMEVDEWVLGGVANDKRRKKKTDR